MLEPVGHLNLQNMLLLLIPEVRRPFKDSLQEKTLPITKLCLVELDHKDNLFP